MGRRAVRGSLARSDDNGSGFKGEEFRCDLGRGKALSHQTDFRFRPMGFENRVVMQNRMEDRRQNEGAEDNKSRESGGAEAANRAESMSTCESHRTGLARLPGRGGIASLHGPFSARFSPGQLIIRSH